MDTMVSPDSTSCRIVPLFCIECQKERKPTLWDRTKRYPVLSHVGSQMGSLSNVDRRITQGSDRLKLLCVDSIQSGCDAEINFLLREESCLVDRAGETEVSRADVQNIWSSFSRYMCAFSHGSELQTEGVLPMDSQLLTDGDLRQPFHRPNRISCFASLHERGDIDVSVLHNATCCDHGFYNRNNCLDSKQRQENMEALTTRGQSTDIGSQSPSVAYTSCCPGANNVCEADIACGWISRIACHHCNIFDKEIVGSPSPGTEQRHHPLKQYPSPHTGRKLDSAYSSLERQAHHQYTKDYETTNGARTFEECTANYSASGDDSDTDSGTEDTSDTDDTIIYRPSKIRTRHKLQRRTKEMLTVLKEHNVQLIKDVSEQLVQLLQERHELREQVEMRKIAVEQLLRFQTDPLPHDAIEISVEIAGETRS